MSAQVTYSDAEVRSFVEALREFPDGRDNRGKRHALGFVVAAVVLAILNGRSKVSSRYRYLDNVTLASRGAGVDSIFKSLFFKPTLA